MPESPTFQRLLAESNIHPFERRNMTDLIPYTLPDIKDLLAGRLAASTIAIYRLDIGQYQEFCAAHDLAQFDPQSFVGWRDHLVVDTVLSPNTINRQLAVIRRTIKEAASRRLISSAVAYDFSVVESVSVRALRGRLKKHSKTRILPAQMRALCDSPGTATLLGQRDTAMLHTLASSGLRISELVRLTSEQIDQAGDYYTMRIIGKTDVEARLAPLSVEAKQHIDSWIAARLVESEYVFTSFEGRGAGKHEYNRLTPLPMSDVSAWRIVTGYAQQCGLEYIKPHDFRRFVATELSAKNVIDAQRALGHKNLNRSEEHTSEL